jgi:hypothetical protein
MPKKKVFAARNLKDCLPSLPLKTEKQQKENQSFLSRRFCASLKVPKKAEVSIEWRTTPMRRKKQNVEILIFILLLFKYLSGPVSCGSNVGSVGSSLDPDDERLSVDSIKLMYRLYTFPDRQSSPSQKLGANSIRLETEAKFLCANSTVPVCKKQLRREVRVRPCARSMCVC